MGIITLTTDLGLKDHYVATLKGTIYSLVPSAIVVDISHQVSPFNIIQTAYYIINSYKDFPKGTVHVIGVKSEPVIDLLNPSKNMVPSILFFDGHYFISNDNGIFGLILNNQKPDGFWNIDDVLSNTKYMKDPTKFMLVPAACQILNKQSIDEFASATDRYMNYQSILPVLTENRIVGKIVHVDNYGNLITNISKKDFANFGDNTPFEIRLKRNGAHVIESISMSYGDVELGGITALFNLGDYLEIGINQAVNGNGGGASKLLGLITDDEIFVDFFAQGSRNDINSLFHA